MPNETRAMKTVTGLSRIRPMSIDEGTVARRAAIVRWNAGKA
jgi:hypothetical protein